jgi:polysaccharide pyruvyl transferase WcaK-like protein
VATRFEELSEQMSQAVVVVASPYHNLICALRLGRPVVSLSYGEEERLGAC